ncbi:MAG: hypothetical protein Q9159_001676 [Coniocarpon cinnabarinum]
MASEYPEPSSSKAFPTQGVPYFVPGVRSITDAQGIDQYAYNDNAANFIAYEGNESAPDDESDSDALSDEDALLGNIDLPGAPLLSKNVDEDDADFDPSDLDGIQNGEDDDRLSDSSIGEDRTSSQQLASATSNARGRGRGRGRARGRGGRGSSRGRGRGPGGPRTGRARGRATRSSPPDAEIDINWFERTSRAPRTRARGEGWRGGRRGPRGPRVAPPTRQFNTLQAKATTAFISKRYEDCAQLCIDAIEINPEIWAVHSLLSSAYAELGRKEDSIEVLFNGALTRREASAWKEVEERTKEIIPIDQEEEREQRLLIVYNNILRVDRDDYDARVARLAILQKSTNSRKVIKESMRALADHPHDLFVLRVLGDACLKNGTAATARPAWEAAISHFVKRQSSEDEDTFHFDDLNIYLEIVQDLNDWQTGLREAKRLARWLLGRHDDVLWDHQVDDDREWDDDDEPRRIEVAGFTAGKYAPDQYGQGLPADIRVKLGLFRLNLGREHLDEAMGHFEAFDEKNLPPEAKHDFADLLRDISAALHAHEYHAESLHFFEALIGWPDLDAETLKRAGLSSAFLGDEVKAVQYLERYLMRVSRDTEVRIRVAAMQDRLGDHSRIQVHIDEIVLRETIYTLKSKQISDEDATILAKHLTAKTSERESSRGGATDRSLDEDVELALIISNGGCKSPASPQQDLLRSFGKLTAKPRPRGPYAPRNPLRPLAKKPEGPPSEQRRTAAAAGPADTSLDPVEKHWRRQAKAIRKVEGAQSQVKKLHIELQEAELRIKQGDEGSHHEWTSIGFELCEEFFEQRSFFIYGKQTAFLGFTAQDRVRSQSALPKTKDFLQTWAAHLMQKPEDEPANGAVYAHYLEDMPMSYGGISFPQWLTIMLQTCMNLARDRASRSCYTVLDRLVDCSLFVNHRQSEQSLYLAYLACAIALRDDAKQNELVRHFVQNRAPDPDVYRLFQIVNRLWKGKVHFYSTGPQQKYFARIVRAHDHLAMTTAQRARSMNTQLFARYNSAALGSMKLVNTGAPARDPDPDVVDVNCLDAQLLTACGNMISANNSHQVNALNYYMRAYAAQPDNPLVLLCAMVAYATLSMKRLSATRHHQVLSAVSAFTRYKEIRLQDGNGNEMKDGRLKRQRRMETDFNEGRMWHLWGLMHLAVPCYERVFALAEEQEAKFANSTPPTGSDGDVEMTGADENSNDAEENEGVLRDEPDFTMEAALAMQSICVQSGDVEEARRLTERWLVF